MTKYAHSCSNQLDVKLSKCNLCHKTEFGLRMEFIPISAKELTYILRHQLIRSYMSGL